MWAYCYLPGHSTSGNAGLNADVTLVKTELQAWIHVAAVDIGL